MFSVKFISNEGSGHDESVNVEPGTTAAQLFHTKLGRDANPANYRIRVNHTAVAASYVLQDGDILTATPSKLQGA